MAASPEIQTVIYVRNGDQLLLGLKKRGFATGTWNGYGGKANLDETPVHCAVRELQEECGLVVAPEDFHYVGILKVKFDGKPDRDVYTYTVDYQKLNGQQPKRSEEMEPKWFGVDEIPYDQMLKEAKEWFPFLLKGEDFHVTIQPKINSVVVTPRK